MPHYFYDPLAGHGLPHDPFKAIVAPRLIGWISSRDTEGTLNLAPYSFFGAFASSPPIIRSTKNTTPISGRVKWPSSRK